MYVNIVLFDDFETLDAFGPAEVFGNLPEEFHVRYLSVSGDVINSVHGVKVWTDFLVPEEIDGILILPGGKGARRLLWIKFDKKSSGKCGLLFDDWKWFCNFGTNRAFISKKNC